MPDEIKSTPEQASGSAGAEPQAGKVETKTATAAPKQELPPVEDAAEEWQPERAKKTIEHLREIEKQAKKDHSELEQLRAEKQKVIEAQMSESERLKAQAEKLSSENELLKAQVLRQEVISETGLPSILADRLKGSTKDELLADAKKLMELLPPREPSKKAPNVAPTNPANGELRETDAQKRQRLFGQSQGNVFSIDKIKAAGGGVFYPKENET